MKNKNVAFAALLLSMWTLEQLDIDSNPATETTTITTPENVTITLDTNLYNWLCDEFPDQTKTAVDMGDEELTEVAATEETNSSTEL